MSIKRGEKTRLPTLPDGELGFCTDTKELFIGTIDGNFQVTAPSGSDQTYTHTQSVPELVWTITLPDGFKEFPAVTITDSSGRQVFGQVDYTYPVVTLTFGGAFSGKASFN